MKRLPPFGLSSVQLTLVAMAISFCFGCSQTLPDREVRMTHGYVYYLDGAGAGGGFKNYSHCIRKGLLAAGYDGSGENFHWQTGFGMTIDQIASEEYKRKRATEVAEKIVDYETKYPDAPVTIMGHSAGTAVVVFALEALPENTKVENVILLSGSLSSDYCLTKALQHVNGRMYITTSKKDSVLQFLVPLSGTADRTTDSTNTIGVEGASQPPTCAEETRKQYTKVIEIPWHEQFKEFGDSGAHSDPLKPSFVEAVVAPLVVTNTVSRTPTAAEMAGKVLNPDYDRWAKFAPGSWVQFEGFQEIDGQREPVRMKATLLARNGDRLMVQRAFEPLGKYKNQTALTRLFFASPFIDPTFSPLTHPKTIVKELPVEMIDLLGRSVPCKGRIVQTDAIFRDWGASPEARVYLAPELPGGFAKIDLHTNLEGHEATYSGTVTNYFIEQ